jgi:4-amino-4-deoxy-L-arabinose transferase-like glycosyltransferase
MSAFNLIFTLAAFSFLFYTLGGKPKGFQQTVAAVVLFLVALAWNYIYDYHISDMNPNEERVCVANPNAIGCEDYLKRACERDPETVGCDRLK